jgi:hypothetical protein
LMKVGSVWQLGGEPTIGPLAQWKCLQTKRVAKRGGLGVGVVG